MYGRGKKLSKPKTQTIRNLFILKKEKNKLKIEQLEIFEPLLKQKKKEKKERN